MTPFNNPSARLKRTVRLALEERRSPSAGTPGSSIPEKSALVRRIKDAHWSDADLAAHISSMSAREASDGSINGLTSSGSLLPIQLAVLYDRPVTVHAMFHAGANMWLDREGWAEIAQDSSCLPVLREVLDIMAPPGVRMGQRFTGIPSPPPAPPPRIGFPLPFPPDDDLGAWFDLAEQMVVSAARGLPAHPGLVMRFLLSVRDAWPDRPHDKGRPWSDVMTRALDSMVVGWLRAIDVPIAGIRVPPIQKGIAAIRQLVDLGADPRPDRVISDDQGRPVVWCGLVRSAFALRGFGEPIGWSSFTEAVLPWMSGLAAAGVYPALPASTISDVDISDAAIVTAGSTDQEMFSVDVDEIPDLAANIAARLMDRLVAKIDVHPELDEPDEDDGEDSDTQGVNIPVGRYGSLSIDTATGRLESAFLRSDPDGREALRASVQVHVLRLLPDMLDHVSPDVLQKTASDVSSNPWSDVLSFPGVLLEPMRPLDVRFRLSAIRSALSWPPTDHLAKDSVQGAVERSLQARMVSHMAAASLDDVAIKTVNLFVKTALEARRSLASDSSTVLDQGAAADWVVPPAAVGVRFARVPARHHSAPGPKF